MKKTKFEIAEYIDITPTWSQILPALCVVLKNGNPKGYKIAWIELEKMAKLADLYVADQKKNQ